MMRNDPVSTATGNEQFLALLLADMTDAVLRGEEVDLEQVCGQHPEHSAELRRLWGAVMVADAAGSQSHVSQKELSDWPEAVVTLPCRFAGYELLEEIGRGGMGIVYRARQVGLDREVAVKMILRGPLASGVDRQRFRVEAEATARLEHPNIVSVYEVGESRVGPYFSMKYIRGRTLASLVAAQPLPPRKAARILAAVARGIGFAHQHGILHRDLKPSNILVDQHGQPMVTDFGLAKHTGQGAVITQTGDILGTPAYMAPEQAAGDRGQVGPASDVYSLGAILYYMLTGRPPFQAVATVDTLLMVLEQDPVPPRMLNPQADRDLEMIALRCLQKPADLRYPTANDLASDLEAYLKGEPIAARGGQFVHLLTQVFRETHHAPVLENWGVLWMWHSLVLLIACVLTNALLFFDYDDRWVYIMLWTAGLGTWAGVFWALRRRVGPVTFVERQIAHVWGASMVAIGLLFFIETLLGMPVLTLSPVVALVTGMVFLIKAGILSGAFYVQAAALFATAFLMALLPAVAHLIFGVVAAVSFFVPGLKYYRQRCRAG